MKCSLSITSALLLGAMVLLAGCELTNPVEDAKLMLNFSSSPTAVSGQIVDAATGEVIEDRDVQVTFMGADAPRVVDASGMTQTAMKLSGFGALAFNLKGDVPTADAPADVRLQVRADGYLTTNQPLRLTGDDNTFIVRLVRLDDAPTGVNVVQDQSVRSTSAGAVEADAQIATAPDPETGASVAVHMAKGTVLRTKDGRTLSGPLTTTIVYFNGKSSGARAAFPGGLMGVTVEQGTEGQASGLFVTTGVASIEVRDRKGRSARRFDTPMTITMQVPSGMKNFETRAPLQAGDPVPVYSFETDTGAWKLEGRATAEGPDARGYFTVTFETNHLTYFDLGWLSEPTCETSGRIDLAASDASECTTVNKWELALAETDELIGAGHVDDNFLEFGYAPADLPVVLKLFADEQEVATETIPNLCAYNGAVTVPPAAREDLVSVDFDVTLGCTEPPVEVRPSITISYRAVALDEEGRVIGYPRGTQYINVRMKNGTFRLSCLEKHTAYEFKVFYEGEEYRRVFNIARDENKDRIVVDGIEYLFDEYGLIIEKVSDTEYEVSLDYTLKEGEGGGFCENQ